MSRIHDFYSGQLVDIMYIILQPPASQAAKERLDKLKAERAANPSPAASPGPAAAPSVLKTPQQKHAVTSPLPPSNGLERRVTKKQAEPASSKDWIVIFFLECHDHQVFGCFLGSLPKRLQICSSRPLV